MSKIVPFLMYKTKVFLFNPAFLDIFLNLNLMAIDLPGFKWTTSLTFFSHHSCYFFYNIHFNPSQADLALLHPSEGYQCSKSHNNYFQYWWNGSICVHCYGCILIFLGFFSSTHWILWKECVISCLSCHAKTNWCPCTSAWFHWFGKEEPWKAILGSNIDSFFGCSENNENE